MKVLHRADLRKATSHWVLAALALVSPVAWSADMTIPNTFVSGTPATAAAVNENFIAAKTAVDSKQDLVTGTCPSGSAIRGINANGTVVCQQLNFFGGDGSSGNLTISANTDWTAVPPVNLNFADVTINAGQTLTVPAGTTIRCSGTFTNNGTLAVATGARVAGFEFFDMSAGIDATLDVYGVAHPGDAVRPAIGGTFDNSAGGVKFIQGGFGGDGIPRATARTSFNSFRIGGGSGGGWKGNNGAGGISEANGGGLMKIYCTGSIANSGTGTINANGQNNTGTVSGGGGGGIVVLASTTSVTNSGIINANGGNGGASFAWGGAGGGGGGGIVVFAAPAITVGTVNVAGGSGGSTVIQVNQASRLGGGGGGASGGNGGRGSDIPAAASATATTPTSGTAGYVQDIVGNPAFLLH